MRTLQAGGTWWDGQGAEPEAALARAFLGGTKDQQRQAASLAARAGADLNRRSDESGSTMLMSAAGCGNTNKVEILCALGADVSARRADGATALWIAAIEHGGHVEAMEILLARGADPRVSGPAESSLGDALLEAAISGDPRARVVARWEAARSSAQKAPARPAKW